MTNKGGVDEEDECGDYYDCVLTPNNAPDDCKTGVTFRGKDAEYLKAHKILMDMSQKRGDRYIINETEFNVMHQKINQPQVKLRINLEKQEKQT